MRIECLKDDLAPIEAHLGFRLSLQRANASARPDDYRKAYSDHDAALVAELCCGDIEAHGYNFDEIIVGGG